MLPLKDLVRHVRTQRVLRGLSQAGLAAEAGVSQSLVAKLERGSLNPSYESVRLLLEALERHSRREEVTAAQIMHRGPVHADPGDGVGPVLALMKRHGLSQVPVLERGVPVGSFSESGAIRRIERGADLDRLKRRCVGEVMEASFPMVGPATRRRVLVELLRDGPVVLVMEGGRLVGVVGKADLW